MRSDADADADADSESALFTYGVPFVGVLVVAVGIAAAVPGAYALIQEDITTCGAPTVAVESPEETDRRFGDRPPATVDRLDFTALAAAEQAAFEAALDDPIREAHVEGEFPNAEAFRNGTLVAYDGEQYYATVVAENPCFQAPPLQFPLGVFAIALGVVGILTPPAYRKLVALEGGLE
jgi:hypothetical protein